MFYLRSHFSHMKKDDFINVNKRDLKVQTKINNMLDRYNRLRNKYQSKLGHDMLIQNVILKEMIILKGTTVEDMDIELKMIISRI